MLSVSLSLPQLIFRRLAPLLTVSVRAAARNLRLDSLSQLLTSCSVRAGGRYLVLESGCLAVSVAAVLERLAGYGHLVHLFQGGTPQR